MYTKRPMSAPGPSTSNNVTNRRRRIFPVVINHKSHKSHHSRDPSHYCSAAATTSSSTAPNNEYQDDDAQGDSGTTSPPINELLVQSSSATATKPRHAMVRSSSDQGLSSRQDASPLAKEDGFLRSISKMNLQDLTVSNTPSSSSSTAKHSSSTNPVPIMLPTIPPFRHNPPQCNVQKPETPRGLFSQQHRYNHQQHQPNPQYSYPEQFQQQVHHQQIQTEQKQKLSSIVNLLPSPKSSANDINVKFVPPLPTASTVTSAPSNTTTMALRHDCTRMNTATTTTTVEINSIQFEKPPHVIPSILKKSTHRNAFKSSSLVPPSSSPVLSPKRRPSDFSSETSTTATSSYENIEHSITTIASTLTSASSYSPSTNGNTITTTSSPKHLQFDPKIWVHEFHPPPKHIWFTKEELQQFKEDSIIRIRRWYYQLNKMNLEGMDSDGTTNTGGDDGGSSCHLTRNSSSNSSDASKADDLILPSGTGRVIHKSSSMKKKSSSIRKFPSTALFSDPALSAEWEEEEEQDAQSYTSFHDLCSSSSSPSSDNVKTSSSSTSIHRSVSPLSTSIARYEKQEQKILHNIKTELKSILVVDPHDIFLKLLTKGILAMLPHADISFAHSAAEARMKIMGSGNSRKGRYHDTIGTDTKDTPASYLHNNDEKNQGDYDGETNEGNQYTHGFDVIIVEERLGLLNRRSSRFQPKLNNYTKSQFTAGSYDNNTDTNEINMKEDMSGANLIRWIKTNTDEKYRHDTLIDHLHQQEPQYHTASANTTTEASQTHDEVNCDQNNFISNSNSNKSTGDVILPKRRLPLLIGMSAYLKQDQEHLRDCGSDYIWSKPPPPMGRDLRNEMLRLVMLKRNCGEFSQV